MNRTLIPIAILAVVAGRVSALQPVPADHATKMADSQKLFKETIRELLTKNCLECHGGGKTKSELSIASRELLLKGGDRGPTAIPGKPKESRLIEFVTRTDDLHMPPKGQLSKEAIAALTKWIELGAAYDKPLVEGLEPTVKKPMVVTDKDKQYWAYRPLQKTEPPVVKATDWPRNAIDRFILAKQEPIAYKPAPDSDKRTLLRRVTFDITGLPPSADDVDKFVADTGGDLHGNR